MRLAVSWCVKRAAARQGGRRGTSEGLTVFLSACECVQRNECYWVDEWVSLKGMYKRQGQKYADICRWATRGRQVAARVTLSATWRDSATAWFCNQNQRARSCELLEWSALCRLLPTCPRALPRCHDRTTCTGVGRSLRLPVHFSVNVSSAALCRVLALVAMFASRVCALPVGCQEATSPARCCGFGAAACNSQATLACTLRHPIDHEPIDNSIAPPYRCTRGTGMVGK